MIVKEIGCLEVERKKIPGKLITSLKFPTCVKIICFEFSIYNQIGLLKHASSP